MALCAVLGGPGASWSAGALDQARAAAAWAIDQRNADALADSIAFGLDLGGRLDADDPFSVADLVIALRGLPGGDALADDIIARQARGQLGGAPRMDFTLEPGQSRKVPVVLVPHERAFVEARLKSTSGASDVDVTMMSLSGDEMAQDTGPETGILGIAALLAVLPDRCTQAEITVTNAGGELAEVALLVPLSTRSTCEGN